MSQPLPATQLGRLAALGSAASFAAIPPLGRLAYDTGASPGTVVLVRLFFGLVVAGAAIALLRRPWSLPRAQWPGTAAVAVAWIVVTIGYMASFFYIPVSLAVLIFFTFPVLIALAGPLIARTPFEPLILGAALMAFAGLALALGPDLGSIDWRGCALAFAAAAGAATTFLASRRLVVEQDLFSFSFHLHLLAFVAVALGYAVFGWPSPPAGAAGWLPLVGVAAFYASAMLLQFAAIRLTGPARASVVFNAEPVLTMLAAALVLAELLGMWQLMGAALVLAGVALSTHADRRGSAAGRA